MLTKSQARTLAHALLDDSSGTRWPAPTLDLLFQLVLDELWDEVIKLHPDVTNKTERLTVTSPGYIDLRETADGGQLANRFFRVRRVVRGTGTLARELSEIDTRHQLIENGTEVSAPEDTWAVLGDRLYCFPLTASETIELSYSWKPALWTELAEGAYMPWPGVESAIIFEVVGRATMKGAAEDARGFLTISETALGRLLGTLSKVGPGPQTLYTSDDPESWGGN